MRRYTTPTIELIIGGADLTGCDVLLTLRQGGKRLTVRVDESDDWTVGDGSASGSVTLTQEQTASFDEGEDVEVQANVIDPNGNRFATEIVRCRFGRNLLEVCKSHE